MEQKIYIGMNIGKLGMLKNQVYLDGLPAQVKTAITKFPEIQELIVDVSELTDKQNEMNTSGTHLHHIYKKLEEKIKGGIK